MSTGIITSKEKQSNRQMRPCDRWEKKKLRAIEVAGKLKAIGKKKRAERMKDCGNELLISKCPECGEYHVKGTALCRDRLCPICNWRLSLKRYSEMLQVFENLELQDKTVTLLTLTVKNVPIGELKTTLKEMTRAWKRFQQRKAFKDVIGWARSTEITRNRKTGKMHPHFHILLIWKEKIDSKDYMAILKDTWQLSARLDYKPIVDMRNAYSKEIGYEAVTKAALEAMKYIIKDKAYDDMKLSEFGILTEAIAGIRMIGYGGIIKEERKKLGMKDELENVTDIPVKCPKCNTELIDGIAVWSGVRGYITMTMEEYQKEREKDDDRNSL